MIVYHGGSVNQRFDFDLLPLSTKADSSQLGYFFTPERTAAQFYAGKRGQVAAYSWEPQRTYTMDRPEYQGLGSGQAFRDRRRELLTEGYDAVVIPHMDEYVILKPGVVRRIGNPVYNSTARNPDAVTNFAYVQEGRPVTIRGYRGVGGGPTQLSLKHQAKFGRAFLLGDGIYFTDSKTEAAKYGTVREVEVTLQRPYVIRGQVSVDELGKLDVERLRAEGYDGVVIDTRSTYVPTGESYRQGVAWRKQDALEFVEKPRPVLPFEKGSKVVTRDIPGLRRISEPSRETWIGSGRFYPEVGATGVVTSVLTRHGDGSPENISVKFKSVAGTFSYNVRDLTTGESGNPTQNPVEKRSDGAYILLPPRYSLRGSPFYWFGPFSAESPAAEIAGLAFRGMTQSQVKRVGGSWYAVIRPGPRLRGTASIGPFDSTKEAGRVLAKLLPGAPTRTAPRDRELIPELESSEPPESRQRVRRSRRLRDRTSEPTVKVAGVPRRLPSEAPETPRPAEPRGPNDKAFAEVVSAASGTFRSLGYGARASDQLAAEAAAELRKFGNAVNEESVVREGFRLARLAARKAGEMTVATNPSPWIAVEKQKTGSNINPGRDVLPSDLPWRHRAERLIAEASRQEYERAQTKKGGGKYKKHRPYSLPNWVVDLVQALGENDEERAKVIMMYTYEAQNIEGRRNPTIANPSYARPRRYNDRTYHVWEGYTGKWGWEIPELRNRPGSGRLAEIADTEEEAVTKAHTWIDQHPRVQRQLWNPRASNPRRSSEELDISREALRLLRVWPPDEEWELSRPEEAKVRAELLRRGYIKVTDWGWGYSGGRKGRHQYMLTEKGIRVHQQHADPRSTTRHHFENPSHGGSESCPSCQASFPVAHNVTVVSCPSCGAQSQVV